MMNLTLNLYFFRTWLAALFPSLFSTSWLLENREEMENRQAEEERKLREKQELERRQLEERETLERNHRGS